MIRRLYVHNFRCLENFNLDLAGFSSVLLIGKNGAGKSTVRKALQVLQRIAQGANRLSDLLKIDDFTRRRTELPMTFTIEVGVKGKVYEYMLAIELPNNSKEVRVAQEKFSVDGKPVFSRQQAEVQMTRLGRETGFGLDWHLAALPMVQESSMEDPLFIFKQYLKRLIILSPIPPQIDGQSQGGTLHPSVDVRNFGEWFTGLLALSPRVYSQIEEYLSGVMPDLVDIKNPVIGKEARSLIVQFKSDPEPEEIPFAELSDGEKCYMICALVLAANRAYGPLACFWDEPDNHLALSEVGQFLVALRKEFQNGAQFIATSHHPEAIRRFSDENTFVLTRQNHLQPTEVRRLEELQVKGDLITALMLDEVAQ